ncbi:hypothetical protein [Segatella copri]|nr:hypothetical protein [Segatella copri]
MKQFKITKSKKSIFDNFKSLSNACSKTKATRNTRKNVQTLGAF